MKKMKKMKKIQAIITAVMLMLTAGFMAACANDDKEVAVTESLRGAGEAFATVASYDSISGKASIDIDNSGLFNVGNPEELVKTNTNQTGQRIYCVYYIEGMEEPESTVGILDVWKILTKPLEFLKKGEEDSYGMDGIHISGHYQSKQHLTFQFQIHTAGGSHRISLIAREGATPDEEGYLTLELRHHNESGQANGLSQPSYVSFLITDAPGYKEGTLKGFHIEYMDLNNERQTIKM